MNLPSKVDLRSNYNEVYHQGNDNACGAFATASCLDCIYERKLNRKIRFDPYLLWDWIRWHRGVPGTNTGTDFPSLKRSLFENGARSDLLDIGTVKNIELIRTVVTDVSYRELKELLARGFPIIYEIKVTPEFDNISNTPWYTHQLPANTSVIRGQHYVTIVGYDDNYQRFLVENSWGGSWGDGGFFGLPYASMPSLTESIQHINLLPINPLPYEGFRMKSYLLTSDKSAFVDRSKQYFAQLLLSELENKGVQSMVNLCKTIGISDKHLEVLFDWDRGVVRDYKDQNPSIDFTGFIFEQ